MKIGVLALQGDFLEHVHMLRRLGVEAAEVRLPHDLSSCDGLIIPGGESTTIGKLAVMYDLLEPMRAFGRQKAVWGTCAGAIFLSQDVGRTQPLLKLMDIGVRRNAFGRQVDSFEIDLEVPALAAEGNGQPRAFHAIFIRAPVIERVGPAVEILAQLPDGTVVATREKNLLATSFHPELTGDDRFHRLFLKMASRQI